jgi:hypothetical protein
MHRKKRRIIHKGLVDCRKRGKVKCSVTRLSDWYRRIDDRFPARREFSFFDVASKTGYGA